MFGFYEGAGVLELLSFSPHIENISVSSICLVGFGNVSVPAAITGPTVCSTGTVVNMYEILGGGGATPQMTATAENLNLINS